jgi:hypothetical protein
MYKNNIPYLNLMSIKYRVILLEDRRSKIRQIRIGLACKQQHYRVDDSRNRPNMAHRLLNISTSVDRNFKFKVLLSLQNLNPTYKTTYEVKITKISDCNTKGFMLTGRACLYYPILMQRHGIP